MRCEGRACEVGRPAGIAGPPRAYASRSPPGPSTSRRRRRNLIGPCPRPRPRVEDRAAGRACTEVPGRSRGPDQTSRIGPILERLRRTLGPNARQSLAALGLNSATSFIAGGVLGAITATFAEVPGLLVLVPAAIGLRGNIFGAFGNRISTSIHTGTFRLSLRRETVLGQNLLAAAVLTAGLSAALAVIAKAVAVALGIEGTVGVLDLAVVSIVGGALASTVVMGATLALTDGAVNRDWDLDSVTAPIVSVLGDVLTLPALWLATALVGIHLLTNSLAIVLCAGSVVVVVIAARSRLAELRRIVRESLPILLVAATVSTLAGIALEKRFELFDQYPALLVLVPAHLSSAGALGGILSGRVSTKLLLGTAEPTAWPERAIRSDIWFVAVLALPVYAFNGIGAQFTASLLGQASPGLAQMLGVSLIAGLAAIVFVAAIAYVGAVVSVRTGVDPDTYGIPVVSSSLDLVGAFTLILTITALGIV